MSASICVLQFQLIFSLSFLCVLVGGSEILTVDMVINFGYFITSVVGLYRWLRPHTNCHEAVYLGINHS